MIFAQIDRSTRFWFNPPRWVYLIVLPWLFGLALLLGTARRHARVAARQRFAQGTIVAHAPQDHDRYEYAFTVGSRAYRGWDSPADAPLAVGQRVGIYYDPTDPETSALSDFSARSLADVGPAPLLAFGVASALLAVFVLRRRARQIRRRPPAAVAEAVPRRAWYHPSVRRRLTRR